MQQKENVNTYLHLLTVHKDVSNLVGALWLNTKRVLVSLQFRGKENSSYKIIKLSI